MPSNPFPHRFIIMLSMPRLYRLALITLIGLFAAASQAETNTGETSTEKQQLRSLLQELEKSAKQRQLHGTQVDELSRRLECHWRLIRAYEICGQLHENSPSEHLECSANAKQNAARCLNEDKKKK